MQTSRSCDATANDSNLKYCARHCHTIFLLQIIAQANKLRYDQFFFFTFSQPISIVAIEQGWATYGPQEHFVRLANTFETSVNLSDNDRRGNNCYIKEPKTLHATLKKAFVSLHRRIFRPFRE